MQIISLAVHHTKARERGLHVEDAHTSREKGSVGEIDGHAVTFEPKAQHAD